MPRNPRFHIDDLPEQETPKHLTRHEFGKRLYKLMLAKGWNQSELARQADLPRDSISTYVRGRVLPTPKSLRQLANALDCNPTDILPNAIEGPIMEDPASFEMKVSVSDPRVAWVRVNRLVSLQTATDIARLIQEDTVRDIAKDDASDAKGGR